MVRYHTFLVVVALAKLLMAACPVYAWQQVPDSAVGQTSVQVGGTRTVIRTYKSDVLSPNPLLVVVLHGDTAPWDRSGAQYVFSETLAARHDDLIAIGMLRPGYVDPDGNRSDGVQGEGIGDNYGPPQTDQIADAVLSLAKHHNARRTILVGESGGAATVANLIALRDGVADRAVLIVCPCDVEAWRASMYENTGKTVFRDKIPVTSPIDLIEDIPPELAITVIAGSRDGVAPPALVRGYYQALIAGKKRAEWILVEGGHGIFLDPAVFEATSRAILAK